MRRDKNCVIQWERPLPVACTMRWNRVFVIHNLDTSFVGNQLLWFLHVFQSILVNLSGKYNCLNVLYILLELVDYIYLLFIFILASIVKI